MAEKYYSEIREVRLSSKNYVLVVPGWYPTWQDQFTGDFNQRQVKAAGMHMPQVVLYIVKDQAQTLTEVETRYRQLTENIVEITVMYPQKKNKWFDQVYSNLVYVQLLYTYASIIENRWGKPLLIHSYIVIRGGLGGFLLAGKWKIPFILSEHWTIFYPEDPGYLLKRNLIFKWIVKKVFKNVSRLLPVTHNLEQQIYKLVKRIPSTVIPNAVETELFFYKEGSAKKDPFRFVHISTMAYQKNPLGLLRAFKRFHELHNAACLWMVGPYPDEVLIYANEIGLPENNVHFTGPVPYNQVSEILQHSEALVLFSRYENLPCVILEALCCGVPVISTNVGGIGEVVDAQNGILLQNENEAGLTATFIKMYTMYENYNRKEIANAATNLFGYDKIGDSIYAVYREIKTLG